MVDRTDHNYVLELEAKYENLLQLCHDKDVEIQILKERVAVAQTVPTKHLPGATGWSKPNPWKEQARMAQAPFKNVIPLRSNCLYDEYRAICAGELMKNRIERPSQQKKPV